MPSLEINGHSIEFTAEIDPKNKQKFTLNGNPYSG